MRRSRRVVHLRASRFVGGPERQILRYARMSHDSGLDAVVASFMGDGEGEALLSAARDQGTETLALPGGSRHALVSLIKELQARPTAMLCTHGYKADILGILAGAATNTPVASFLRGWTGEDLKVRCYEMVNRLLLSFTDQVVCLSESQLAKLGSPKNGRVVTNAVEAPPVDRNAGRSALRQRLGSADDAVVVGSAGRLSPEKGANHFVAAIKLIAAEFPNVHFVIFGDGPLRAELEEMAAGDPRIHFAGHAVDFPVLVTGLDLLVNPSLTEEMPNVVLEAMAAAVPVVATAVGGVPEIAGSPAAIRLAQPGNAAALAEGIAEVLRDPSAAARLGQAGQQRVKENHSPERQQKQLMELFAEFLPDRAKELPALAESPYISVVIPVRNEELHIEGVLRQLEQQRYPADRFEILVCDGNSTDSTRAVVQEAARGSRVSIRLLENPKQLSSAGRNVGVRASRGDIVTFIDGHCDIPNQELLASIVELFRGTGAACLCRPQPLEAESNNEFQNALAHTRATILGHGRDSTIFDLENEREVNPSSSGAIYRTEVFEALGLYDENFDACEDVEFNFRVWLAGYKAISSPRLAVRYSPRKSLGGLWKQLLRYGRGRYRFMRKHPEATTLAQLVPAGFLLSLAALGLASPFSAVAAWAFGGTLLLYLSVVLVFAIHLSFRYGWHHLLISPAVYACIHGGLGMGFWQEALLGRKPQPEAVCAFQRSPFPPSTTAPEPPAGAELMSATSNKG